MFEEEDTAEAQLPLDGAGQKLRLRREEQKLTIEQVAAETRIPIRHLQSIENGDFSSLPSRAYAIGFSRTYANAVGLDAETVISEVRAELALSQGEPGEYHSSFEPGDPAKVPSKGLVWFAAIAALLLLAGIISVYGNYFAAGTGPGSLLPHSEGASAGLAQTDDAVDGANASGQAGGQGDAAQPSASGQVIFTSLEDGVWVRFYDGAGQRLMEKQMASGESFAVPEDATDPQIWTGRPDAFAITIGGQSVPKLAEDDFVMRDVGVSAQALLNRSQQTPEILREAEAVSQVETAPESEPATDLETEPAATPEAAPETTSAT